MSSATYTWTFIVDYTFEGKRLRTNLFVTAEYAEGDNPHERGTIDVQAKTIKNFIDAANALLDKSTIQNPKLGAFVPTPCLLPIGPSWAEKDFEWQQKHIDKIDWTTFSVAPPIDASYAQKKNKKNSEARERLGIE